MRVVPGFYALLINIFAFIWNGFIIALHWGSNNCKSKLNMKFKHLRRGHHHQEVEHKTRLKCEHSVREQDDYLKGLF